MMSIFTIKFRKIFRNLEKKFFNKLILLVFLTLISGLFEILSIGLIIPIITVFVENDFLKYSNYLPVILELTNQQIFLFFICLFSLIYFLKFIVLTFIIYKQNEFAFSLYVNISNKLFSNYLSKNYIFHIKNNSSLLIRNLTSESNIFSFGVVFALVKLFSEIIIFLLISTTLMIYSFTTSMLTIFFISFFGLTILLITSSKVKKWGEERQFHASKIIQSLQQSLYGIKEIILYKLGNTFLKNHYYHNLKSSEAGRKNNTINQIPRLILELISVFTFFSIILILNFSGQDLKSIFINISVFVFASIRLLPSISNIISSIQNLKFNSSVIDLIDNEMNDLKNNIDQVKKLQSFKEEQRISFKKIELENIDFEYVLENKEKKIF